MGVIWKKVRLEDEKLCEEISYLLTLNVIVFIPHSMLSKYNPHNKDKLEEIPH